MNSKQRTKWELTRARGKGRFVLQLAVLFAGFELLVISLFDYFVSPFGFRVQDLYIKLPIYLAGGILTALGIWYYGEYKYRKSADRLRH